MSYLSKISHSSPDLLGIGLRILSGVFFALMAALIKYLNHSIPLAEVVFFRSIVALVPLMIFLLMTSNFPAGLRTQHPWQHVSRCLLGTLAMFCMFATLRYLPIAEATTVSYLSPVILVIFALVFLKETVSRRRWLGVCCGIVGLCMMTLPNFSADSSRDTLIGIAVGVLAATMMAAALLQVRQLSKMGENPGAIALYFALTSTVMGGVLMLGHWVMPTLAQWLCLLGIGLLGGIAQIFMTLAFKYAEASAMAPYEYLSIVWAVIIGFVVFDEVPNAVFWLAMPLILLGAIIARPKSQRQS